MHSAVVARLTGRDNDRALSDYNAAIRINPIMRCSGAASSSD
jgi:hypothetical protein